MYKYPTLVKSRRIDRFMLKFTPEFTIYFNKLSMNFKKIVFLMYSKGINIANFKNGVIRSDTSLDLVKLWVI